MADKGGKRKIIIAFIVAILAGFAAAFWLFYQPQEFIYTFF
jgi:hypothetical protein